MKRSIGQAWLIIAVAGIVAVGFLWNARSASYGAGSGAKSYEEALALGLSSGHSQGLRVADRPQRQLQAPGRALAQAPQGLQQLIAGTRMLQSLLLDPQGPDCAISEHLLRYQLRL